MSDFIFVYITASSEDEANKIARALVEDKLAACVNIIPGMRSIYQWEGKTEENEEIILIAKTRAALFDQLSRLIRRMHSYECPCIVALPILAGLPEFLRWIDEATQFSSEN